MPLIQNNKNIGTIIKNNKNINTIIKNNKILFSTGYWLTKIGQPLILENSLGQPFKNYKVYGNTIQDKTPTIQIPTKIKSVGGSENKILPEGYTEIDYIESHGEEYIDTGYTPTEGDEFEFDNIDISSKQNSGATFFSAGTSTYQLIWQGYGYFKYLATGNALNVPSAQNCNNIKIKYNNNSGDVYINDEYKGSSAYGGPVNTTLNLFRRASGESKYYAFAKLGRVEVKNNNVIKLNLIACYRNSDNEAGLYDTINDVFYTNQGTGAFTYEVKEETETYKIPIKIKSSIISASANDWEQGAFGGAQASNTTTTKRLRTKNYYEIENDKDYYISLENDEYSFVNIFLYDSNKTYLNTYYISVSSTINGAKKLTINVPSTKVENVAYCRITIKKDSEEDILPSEISTALPMMFDNSSNIINITLEEPLRKIGQYADYIEYETQKVVRNIEKVNLGTLDWTYISDTNIFEATIPSKYKIPTDSTQNVDGLCSIAKPISSNNSETEVGSRFYVDSTTNKLIFRDVVYTNVSDFIERMSKEALLLVLANSVEENIELPTITTEKKTYVLTVDTEIESSNVSVEYKKKG